MLKNFKKIVSGFLIFSIISFFLIAIKENFLVSADGVLTIYGENISGKKGDEKNFLIKVKNFENVAGLQIFLEFDKNFLEFEGLNYNKFSSTNGAGEGVLSFVWDDFKNPVTLGNDEKILDLKFKILGENGESEIKILPKTGFFNNVGDKIVSEKINGKISVENDAVNNSQNNSSNSSQDSTSSNSASTSNSNSTNSSTSGGGGAGGGSLSFEKIKNVSKIKNDVKKEVKKVEKKVEKKDENIVKKVLKEVGVFDKNFEKEVKNISPKLKNIISKKFFERKIFVPAEEKIQIAKKISEGKIFSDVKNSWAKNFIGELTAAKIFDETKNFRPNDGVNRAELSKILVKGFDIKKISDKNKKFSDVEKNAWFGDFVNILNQNGIVDGYSDGSFKPGKVVNRAEGLKMVLIAKGIEKFLDFEGKSDFDDVSKDAWFAKYVNFAFENGIISGKSAKKFDPSGKITRAEISKIISLVNGLK